MPAMMTSKMAVLLNRNAWSMVRSFAGFALAVSLESSTWGCMGVAGESMVPLRLLRWSR